jgi:hypothetical protein
VPNAHDAPIFKKAKQVREFSSVTTALLIWR